MKVKLQSVGIVRAGEATQLQVEVALLSDTGKPVTAQSFQYGEPVTEEQIRSDVAAWAKRFVSVSARAKALQRLVGLEQDV